MLKESTDLVCACLLHGKYVGNSQVNALQLGSDSLQSALEIDCRPDISLCRTKIPNVVVRIRACIVGRKSVVKTGRFDCDNLTVISQEFWYTEETGGKILTTVIK